MTLLELLRRLGPVEVGTEVGVVDSQGCEMTVTFGERISVEPPQMAAWGIAPAPAGRWHQHATD